VSRIDSEAVADCYIVLVRLQRSYDRLVSSSCVAPRKSEHWQNVVVCRCSLHWPTCTCLASKSEQKNSAYWQCEITAWNAFHAVLITATDVQ